LDPQPTSLYVEQFLSYLRHRKNRSLSTITTYRSILGFFLDSIKDPPINELSVRHVDEYASQLLLYNFKPKTYRNRLVPVRSFIKYLYQKDFSDLKPESIDIPADDVPEANFLNTEEQDQLIRACNNLQEKALILFIMRSGLRVSEVVNVLVDDVYKRSVVVRCGKGKKPRVTFINEEAERAIKKYHATLQPQTYLFPNSSGGRISRQYVTRLVTIIAKRAGIKKHVSCHTLRHTFATEMLRRGARAEDVQPMLGHKNIRTTLIYMHFTDEYLHQRYEEIMEKTPAR